MLKLKNALFILFCALVSVPFVFFGSGNFLLSPNIFFMAMSVYMVVFGVGNIACSICAVANPNETIVYVVSVNSIVMALMVFGISLFPHFDWNKAFVALCWSVALLANWLVMKLAISASTKPYASA